DGRYRWSILIPGHGGAPLGLATLNITSLPWPLKSSMDFAEHPAHYLVTVQPSMAAISDGVASLRSSQSYLKPSISTVPLRPGV
ncbi:hypothetical protein, partial [Sphingobium chlorophenolicum]|uniref:hypothetical protein n=1 Tax=Sphingobium chlorophenolicum TaxID=46429 RepID=UPI001BDCD682